MTLVRASNTGIVGLQRRLVEVGRIRAGEKVPTSGGRKRPAKRTTWRITSRDETRLTAAAALYGGTVAPWEDRPGEFELCTESDTLDVAVVPGQAITQSFELWGQAQPKSHQGPNPVVCLRRCDGQTEMFTDAPCICANEEEPPCRPTTRLSVILTKVPGLGVWRVESHGKNAAVELSGGVQLLEVLVASNRPIRARLRLDQRRQTVTIRGARGAIKTEERHFVVPVLDIDHTLDEVLSITSIAAPAALVEASDRAEVTGPGFSPVPKELGEGPAPSIAAQVGAVGEPRPPSKRANAAEPLKATGRKPRPAAEVSVESVSPGAGEAAGGESGSAVGGTVPDSPPFIDASVGMSRPETVAMWCRDVGLDDAGRHRFLEAFSTVIGDVVYSSARDVPHEHMVSLRRALDRLDKAEISLDDDAPVLRYVETDQAITKPGTTVPPVGGDGAWDAKRWADALADVPGVGGAKLLKHARSVAGQLGIALPAGLDEIIDQQLVIRCLGWLREQKAG